METTNEAATLNRLKAVADPVRWKALKFLRDPLPTSCNPRGGVGVCGCGFVEILGMAQPTVSHHMKVLVEAGLVTAEKRGRWVFYHLVPEAFEELQRDLAVFATRAPSAVA